ncbi:MAG: glycoside hydrolase family 125 protein [Acidobacteriota bacterium]|nr:glycoside hydrolase family 125 protein [Acidobacteriota bacterium]
MQSGFQSDSIILIHAIKSRTPALKSLVVGLLLLVCVSSQTLLAAEAPRRIPLSLTADDVLPTGNEWISLPTIRASDGAITNFNVLSMRDRGLLEITGDAGSAALQPYFLIDGKQLPLRNLRWELIEYWIPVAHLGADGVEVTMTYCAPPGSRAAFLRLNFSNRRSEPVSASLGLKASWGALNRVTYLPVALRGERSISEAPWVSPGEVFSFVTHDSQFAWALIHPDSQAKVTLPPLAVSPSVDAQKTVTVGPGQTVEANFILAAGIEEFSAAHYARPLREMIDRYGADEIVRRSAEWCRRRTRTTSRPELDVLMNRNFLFTALYAWGTTIDTEQFVGVTSRSSRYYVAAAYWDRDAMLWSFPGLLDIDRSLARQALEYALTTQLRNAGTHSRFIDGVVLEDGFELDEAAAPIIATAEYVKQTNDETILTSHRDALVALRDRLLSRFDPETGLYSTLQDSQDEFQKLPFITYDNVLAWRALLDLAAMFQRLKDSASAKEMAQRAASLRSSIMKYCVSTEAHGGADTIFVCATDGHNAVFADIPPGSLMKLPSLGFVSENDPVFVNTYNWLHSKSYKFSYADKLYGLPGSYRLPFTTSWSVADHLTLSRGREQALKILQASQWDGGIITEGVEPSTAVMDYQGRAFATAAGYVAHAICESYCDKPRK